MAGLEISKGVAADALADRVNCYGIGAWLLEMLDQFDTAPPDGLAVPRSRTPLHMPQHGLSLVLYRRAGTGGSSWVDQVVLESVTFDARRTMLPFALDAATETSVSARIKLSQDAMEGAERASYVLPDARVVELLFHSNAGIRSALIARLGAELAYSELETLFGPSRRGVGQHHL